MPFETSWSRVPLAARWALCLAVAAACVVALVVFVNGHNSSGEVPVSPKKFRAESAQATILIGQEQAPVGLAIPAGPPVTTTLAHAVRVNLQRQVTQATIDGPVQKVHCVVHGGTLARTAYHCVASANGITYFFVAVVTPHTHHAFYCEKVVPPSPSENIPVSARCRP